MDHKKCMSVKNNMELNTQYCQKIAGYKTVMDWYVNETSTPRIKDIKIPTLVAFCKDDPVVPLEHIDTNEMVKNPNVIVAEFNNGGHLAMFKGCIGKPKKYYMRVMLEFINAMYDE